jgi:hypothetical protein
MMHQRLQIKMKPAIKKQEIKRCRHRDSWLIGGSNKSGSNKSGSNKGGKIYEWCYQCGALRSLRLSNDENICYPITQWTRPTGSNLKNPYPMKPLKKR